MAGNATSAAGVTLPEAIKAALQRPEFTRAEALTLDKAVAHAELMNALEGPKFNLGAKVNFGFNSQLGASDVNFERDRLALGGSYYLFDSGLAKDNEKAARADAQAIKDSNTVDRIGIIEKTTTTFFEGLEAEELQKVDSDQLALAQKHLEGVNARLELGDATKGELYLAESAVDKAKASVSLDVATLANSEARLALLMGRNTSRDLLRPTAPPDSTFQEKDYQQIVDKAVASSPTLAKLKDQSLAEKSRLSAIKAGFGPTLLALSGVGYVEYQDPFQAQNSFSRPYAYLELRASMPVFAQKIYKEDVREQQDTLDAKSLAYQEEMDQIQLQAHLSLSDLVATEDALKSADSAVTQAKEAYRLASEKYNVGRGTQIDVLSAMQVLVIDQELEVSAKLKLDLINLSLERLTGGYTTDDVK